VRSQLADQSIGPHFDLPSADPTPAYYSHPPRPQHHLDYYPQCDSTQLQLQPNNLLPNNGNYNGSDNYVYSGKLYRVVAAYTSFYNRMSFHKTDLWLSLCITRLFRALSYPRTRLLGLEQNSTTYRCSADHSTSTTSYTFTPIAQHDAATSLKRRSRTPCHARNAALTPPRGVYCHQQLEYDG
jgi:hypothetical protein